MIPSPLHTGLLAFFPPGTESAGTFVLGVAVALLGAGLVSRARRLAAQLARFRRDIEGLRQEVSDVRSALLALRRDGTAHLAMEAHPGAVASTAGAMASSAGADTSPAGELATVRPSPYKLAGAKLGVEERARLRGRRVLVADDGPGNRRVLQRALSGAGMKCELAANGRSAVDLVLSEADSLPFEVIVLDLSMPELDGFAAARELRNQGVMTPILGLTSNELEEELQRALDAGCRDVLHKPVEREPLLRALFDCLPEEPASAGSAAAEQAAGADSGARPIEATESLAPGPTSIARSLFADDEDMTDLIEWFTRDLRGDVDRIAVALDAGDLEELGRIAHQLRGSGGSYGFPILTRAASRLESAVLAGDERRSREKAEALAAVCRHISGS